MKLSSCPKNYRHETHRTKSPEETYEIVKGLTTKAGITRVADITGLDRLKIPVFSCIRPDAADGAISVYNGKGATEMAARVSAIMEGLERFSAEINGREFITAPYEALVFEGKKALLPDLLILPEYAQPEFPLPWYPAYDIMKNKEILVPIHAVFHPVPSIMGRLFRTNTNGIASGNTLEEAVLHGLCEVIERDAWSLAEASGNGGPIITDITNPMALSLIESFHREGVDVILRDITNDIGIPTIVAVGDDVTLKDPTLLCIGIGTHPCPEIAIIRALTEVAQSRATQIHGAREDTNEGHFKRQIGYDRAKRLNRKWFAETSTIKESELLAVRTDDFLDDINEILKRLAVIGITRVIVADVTLKEIGIPVVRVIVPGLECFAMDSERRGLRCKNASRRYLPGAKSVKI